MNYCCYCGTKLMVNAKFCSNCGEPIPSEEEQPVSPSVSEDVLDVQILDSTEDKASISPYIVKLCGRELKFDPRFEEYNKLRRRYFDQGNTSKQEFVSYYETNIHDLDTLYDKGLEFFLAKAKDCLEFSVSIAHGYGAMSVNMEWYLQFFDDAHGFCSILKYYQDISVQLIALAEAMESYRAAKSERHSYWQGGGFGIVGAIKGALTASALNLGSDMMCSIGNAIASSSDRAKFRKLAQNIYQERDHCKYLASALDSWYEAMWRVTEDVLKEYNLVPDFDSGSALMPILEADDIVHNATTNTPDSEYNRAIDLIIQGLPHDPYCPIMAYTALYQIPQTDKNEIQEFVRFLGIEKEYNIKKNELVSDLIAPILEMPESTISQIDKKLCAFKKFHTKFPDYSISAYTQQLKKKKKNIEQAEADAAAKKAEEKAAAEKAEEERKLAIEKNIEDFEAAKQLPENTLAQTQAKYDALKALSYSPRIETEKNRIKVKLDELDFIAAFSSGLNPQIYANALVNNIIFCELYNQLEWNIDRTAHIVKSNFEIKDVPYDIVIAEKAKSRLMEIRSSYAPYKETEIPILYTNYHSDERMLLTNQKLYIKAYSKKFSIPLTEVSSIKLKKRVSPIGIHFTALTVNGLPSFDIYFGEKEYVNKLNTPKVDIGALQNPVDIVLIHIIEFFINYCLFTASSYSQRDEPFSATVLKSINLPMDDFLTRKVNINEESYFATPPASSKSSTSSGCFITSAVCRTLGKPDDCYELSTFRNFRDNWLCGQPDGQTLIREYYQVAPAIVEKIDLRPDSKAIYQSIWETYLLPCLHNIELQRFSQCKNIYVSMVKQLRNQFC